MSARQCWFATNVAKAILICACVPPAFYGQSIPTANWTGGGGDNNWGTGKNWSWQGDDGQCSDAGTAIPPGTFLDNTSICYTANVMIPGGFTVNENVQFMSIIQNFTLGASSTFNGNVNPEGNAMVAAGAMVDGSINAATGVLTNQGTITGSASGATIVNSGKINGSGSVFVTNAGTNTGVIEALGAGGGPYLTGTGALSLTGPWNNAGGTIQIDNGAALICDATITDGNLIGYGSGVVSGAGSGLTIAGTVNSTSLTIDGSGGPTTVTVTGTLNNSGTLIVGQTNSVSTLKVNGGALNVMGVTILGAQSAATGQMIITGTSSPITTQGLTIGQAGSGYVSVSSATLNAGGIIVGSQPSGNGQLNVGVNGVVNYSGLDAITGNPIYGGAISVSGSGNLVGASEPQQSTESQADHVSSGRAMLVKHGLVASYVSQLSAAAQVYGIWKAQAGLNVVAGGSLTVEVGGAVGISCMGCPNGSSAFEATGNSTVDVIGSMSTLAAGNSSIGAGAMLTLRGGANATVGNLQNAGTVTVDTNSQMNLGNYMSMGGILTVQNQAQLSADQMLLATFNTNKLTIQSGAAVTAQVVRVGSGGALIATGGVLKISVESNGNSDTIRRHGMFAGDAYDISIGAGAAPGTLTLSDTGKLSGAKAVGIYPGGTLQITNNDSVNVPGLVSLAQLMAGASARAAGATINVVQGALTIGTVSGSGTQGWVTVGPGGTLQGGVICPQMPSPANPCIPNTLVGPLVVDGSVSNVGGTVSLDPTTLNIAQNFQQTSGTLDLQIQGTQPGQYDQVTAGGSIQIGGGTMEFDFGDGFAPKSGDKFNLLSAPGGISTGAASLTTTGLASGFNYTTSTSSGEFDLTATNSGTSTTSAPAPPPAPTFTSVDAASSATPLAPGSLATGYGTGLATGQPASASLPWPTTLGGTSVAIVDVTGATTQAPLLYVSSTEVNYQIPDTVALGPATVTVTAGDRTTASGPVNVVAYAPGLFAVNSAGLSAAYADCISASGQQSYVQAFQVVNGAVVAAPLNLAACQETVLVFWATGIDAANASAVEVTIGGVEATVLYSGPQGYYPGVDQINAVIPQSLAGAGNVPIVLSTGGVTSNTVNVTIQ